MRMYGKKRFTSSQIIIFGFLLVILAGSVILMLPVSSENGKPASFLDALFTSVSATCVTGLVVQDTATYWSSFGQLIILLLIQIGGMGVVTVSIALATVSRKRIGLAQRSTMQESIAAPSIGGIVRMTRFILKAVIFIELAGAVLLMPVFCREFGAAKGIWYAFFHSISAFCNAGFDLMGEKGEFSSLTGYTANGFINAVVIVLILIGGIGFLTWNDIKENRMHIRAYRMQSKVILLMAVILIIVPFCYFFFWEFGGQAWEQMTWKERFWGALFQAVTPRTAGYNTMDLTRFSEAGQTMITVLMLIGGAPGSTAGGMKVTTVAVMFMTAFSVFRRRAEADCFGRRIEENTIKFAATVMLMYITLFLLGGILISCIERLPMGFCLFETASALGTVGLTLGLTPTLGAVSRFILMLLMFFGRIGGLTLVFAAFTVNDRGSSRLPKEKITVG